MKKVDNVIMFVSDDLRPELNCFGKTKLHTPNLDRLAARSVMYERAYCNFPQCMPSRASVMTGIRPQQFVNWSNMLCLDGEPTLPGYLSRNGVRTISTGKIYHEPLDDAYSWDELYTQTFQARPHGGMEHRNADYQLEENRRKEEHKTRVGYPGFREIWEGLPPISECADVPDSAYVEYEVASQAIECMRRHKDKPGIFLGVGFQRPHLPWVAPRKYWDLYDRSNVDLADNPFFPRNGVGKSDLCDLMHYGDQEIQDTYSDFGKYHDDDFPVMSEDKQRECVHGYWASVSFMDAQVGRVLDELQNCGMADNTAVIFWGDNGWHLGEHKLWTKITNFEESNRVPLLLSVPGETKGERTRELVELVDIYPTVCDLLGLKRPQHLHGEALPTAMPDGTLKGKDKVFVCNWNGRTVLNDRYRFSWYPDAPEQGSVSVIAGRGAYELFDHEKDPKENENVVADGQHATVVAKMKDELHGYYGEAQG